MPVAPCKVRGLAPVAQKVESGHGPIPARLFEIGLLRFEDAPHTERFFAIRWNGDAYRLVVPEQEGTASSLKYVPPEGAFSNFSPPRESPDLAQFLQIGPKFTATLSNWGVTLPTPYLLFPILVC